MTSKRILPSARSKFNWRAKAAAGPAVAFAVFMSALNLAGCFSFTPSRTDQPAFAHNIVSAEKDDVRVSIAVLNEQEENQYFGRPLANKGIQAVWMRIENRNPFALWLMPRATDPEYFSALETSYLDHIPFATRSNQAMDQFFREHGIARVVSAHTTNTGFVFTNLSEGAKYINVELWHAKGVTEVGFFLQLPNGRFDYETTDMDGLYTRTERKAVSLNQLRQVLADFECCAQSGNGRNGDPLNIVLIGSQSEIFTALVQQDWDPTHTAATSAVKQTIMAFLSGARYRYSPISSLYLFGRRQDIALQKARSTIHQRNHLRLWLSPYTYQGRDIWIGQISRDIGVRFTTASPSLTTHKIDPDVDESRDYLVEDLAAASMIQALAYVKGASVSTIEHSAHNLTGDPYYTDGLRVVIFLAREPVPIEQVDFVQWENLVLDKH
jgi:hypothetical protein